MSSGAKNLMLELLAKSDFGNIKIHDNGFDLSLLTGGKEKLRAFIAAQPKPAPGQKITLNYSEQLPAESKGPLESTKKKGTSASSHRKDVRHSGSRTNRPK
jgi:hypothetical protein